MQIRFGDAAHILLTHLAKVQPRAGSDEPDQRFDQQDLVNLASRENCPGDLKGAAEYFIGNQEEFVKLETAAGILPADGHAGRQDLVAAASQRLSFDEAVDIVGQHGPMLDNAAGGAPDMQFGRHDLHAAMHRSDVPAEVSEAAYYFLSRPEEFNRLDFAAGLGMPQDGYIGPADIRASQMNRTYQGYNP